MRPKILVVLGTRPEAIKLVPLIRELEASERLTPIVCATAQHRELLDSVLDYFGIRVHFDLNLMRPAQGINDVASRVISGVDECLKTTQPSWVLVQGDTTTSFAAALAAFHRGIPVGHVEAGLRTGRPDSPFPEEANRRLTSVLCGQNFAPTLQAARNLAKEGVSPRTIHLTGNTGIDALLWTMKREGTTSPLAKLWGTRRLILLTVHRRESFGDPLEDMLQGVRDAIHGREDFHVVCPVHPNPEAGDRVRKILGDCSNVALIPPVSYPEMVSLIRHSHVILSDSGGVQEEAPTLGKPLLVLRETTERPEGIESGNARLTGFSRRKVRDGLSELLDPDSAAYRVMSRARPIYGDGKASLRIVGILRRIVLGEEDAFAPDQLDLASLTGPAEVVLNS